MNNFSWMGDHRLEEPSMRLVLLAESECRVLFDSATITSTKEGEVIGARKSPDGRYQVLHFSIL